MNQTKIWCGAFPGVPASGLSLGFPVLEDVAQDLLRARLAVAVLHLHAGERALHVLLLVPRNRDPVLGPEAEDVLLDLGDRGLVLLVVSRLERLEDVAEELVVR